MPQCADSDHDDATDKTTHNSIGNEQDEHDNETLLEKLDACATLLVDSYEELLEQRAALGLQLDEAYLHMSKARSLMGCANLSVMQIPSELEARVSVQTSACDYIYESETQAQVKYAALRYRLLATPKPALPPTAEVADESSAQDKLANEAALKTDDTEEAATTVNDNEDDAEDQSDSLSLTATLTATKDADTFVAPPLPTWFGVLSPLSLKMSHKAFVNALSTIVANCELQSKIAGLQITYNQLMTEKKRRART